MNTKHTPGPWMLAEQGDKLGVYSASSYRVASVHDFNGNPQNRANAALIVSAPELLAALRDVIGWVPEGTWHTDAPREAVARARAAIAKATGEAA